MVVSYRPIEFMPAIRALPALIGARCELTLSLVAAAADPTPTPAPAPVPTPVPAPAPPAPAPSEAERKIATAVTAAGVMAHIGKLAAVPRASGTPEFRAAVDYVVAQARAAGFEAKIIQHASVGTALLNVVAERKGTAPDVERKVVIAGAHLDSVPRAPGANDNASGSGTLLEIARSLNGIDTRNDVRLIWFDGEERGLLGSRAYVRDYPGELDRAVAMLNADMTGSPNGDVGFSVAVGTSAGVGDALMGVALRNGIKASFRPERHNRSDHAAFDRGGVPSTHFGVSVRTVSKDDPNYHSPRDTPDKINQSLLEQHADLMALGVYHFANTDKRILEPKPPRGIRPDTGPPL